MPNEIYVKIVFATDILQYQNKSLQLTIAIILLLNSYH